MAYDTVRFLALDVASEDSIILSSMTGGWTTNIKYKPYDIEKIEVWTIAGIYNTDIRPESFTHLVFPDGRVYRIKSMRQGPTDTTLITSSGYTPSGPARNGSIIFDCELDALGTLHAVSRLVDSPVVDYSLTARWSRYPDDSGPIEPFQVRPAQMKANSVDELPRITDKAYVKRIASDPVTGPFDVVFVKITGMSDVTINSESSKFLNNLYFICPLDDIATGPTTSGLYRDASNQYPSLFALINFTSAMTGIPTDGIVDIAVSQFCPFELTVGTRSDGATYMSMTGPATWSHTYTNVPWAGSLWSGTIVGYQDSTPIGSYKSVSVNLLSVSADMLPVCQVGIRDVNGDIVHSIEPRYLEWDAINQVYRLTGTYRCYATSSGISSELELPDGSVLQWAEGKLPYTEDAWTNYVLTERNYDREMNMIQRDKAQYELATGAVTSLANGAFTGAFSAGAGAATAGLGMIGQMFDYIGGETVRNREQSAKEKLMKSMPGSAYSDPYGVRYLIRSFMGKHNEAVLILPDGVTSGEVNDYTDYNGFPVSDYYATLARSDLPASGFMQGKLTALTGDSLVTSGEYRRIFEKQLSKGIRFRTIT